MSKQIEHDDGIETAYEPDCDICSACGEHASYTYEHGSNCCNASPYSVDVPDRD